MYALICQWEEAARRVDQLAARADALQSAGHDIPASLARELALAERELTERATALQLARIDMPADRVLH